MIAVGAYLVGAVPLLAIALLDLSWIFRRAADEKKLKIHAIFVSTFLVVAHIAIMVGMLELT